jgi:hypothetical protein
MKRYKYTRVYKDINSEGKDRWRILKNFHNLSPAELEDWYIAE